MLLQLYVNSFLSLGTNLSRTWHPWSLTKGWTDHELLINLGQSRFTFFLSQLMDMAKATRLKHRHAPQQFCRHAQVPIALCRPLFDAEQKRKIVRFSVISWGG